MSLKSLALKLLGFAGVIFLLAAALIAFDYSYNSSRFLRGAVARAISRGKLQAAIGQARYQDGKLKVADIEVFWQGKAFARFEEVDCSLSFAKLWQLGKILVDLKADRMILPKFGTSKVGEFNLKSSLGPLTGRKEAMLYRSEIAVARLISKGSSISLTLEPSFHPRILQSRCKVSVALGATGNIKRLTSRGDLSNLDLKLNEVAELLGFSIYKSDAKFSSIAWDCNWAMTRGFFNSVAKQDLHLKASIAKDHSNYLGVTCQLNCGEASLSFNPASGKEQVFRLKVGKKGLAGSGSLQGGVCGTIACLAGLFPDSMKVLLKHAQKDVCNWEGWINLSNGEFNLEVDSKLGACQLFLAKQGRLVPLRSVSGKLALSKGKYQFALDTLFEDDVQVKATCMGTHNASHAFEGTVRLGKALSFPALPLALQPAVCPFSGTIAKGSNGRVSFRITSNLSGASFAFGKHGLMKSAGSRAELNLSGAVCMPCMGVHGTFIEDGKSAISGSYFTDGITSQLDLDNVIYAKSHYALNAELTQGHLKSKISGVALDLSEAELSLWVIPKYRNKAKEIVVELENLYMKDGKAVRNVSMYSTYNGKHYTGCIFQGSLDSNGFINVTLDGSDSVNRSEGWVCRSNDLGYVLKALGGYKGIERGSLDLTFDIDRIGVTPENPAPLLHGDIRINKFRVEKIPFFLWATCPSALAQLFVERKYSHFDSAAATFCIAGKELVIERGNVKSFSSDIVLYRSKISPSDIVIKGGVAPSWYGVGNLVRWTPVVGNVLERIRMPGVWIPFVWKKKLA